ncbi:rhomboid family intramembrane serine protease [Microbacterium halimionae]|nr:rhomboid family intramembrane serine protease [Microbacterium halimionae]
MTSTEFTRNTENFCYRHPDRQSFVLCQRCLRTICPECQTQAAVGVICPECMKEQVRAQTPAQRTAQRRWSRRPSGSVAVGGRPVVTYSIIGVTVAVFLLQLLTGGAVDQWLAFYAPWLYPSVTGVFEPWRILTGALVHSGFWHIGLNMLALWMIGRSLEPLLGRWRFLTLYVVGALGGSVAVALLAFTTPVVGASGAIFALFGALVVIGRHIGAEVKGIMIVLGINLVIGFLPGFGISWQAHVGGLVAGALLGLIYARTRRASQLGWQIALTVLLVAALIGLLVLAPLIWV